MKGTKKSAKRLKSLNKSRESPSQAGISKRAKVEEDVEVVTQEYTAPVEKRKKKKRSSLGEGMYEELLAQYHAHLSSNPMITPMKPRSSEEIEEPTKKKQRVKFIMQRNQVLRKP
jgi:hypothetical protein